jgi:hypothetical protein
MGDNTMNPSQHLGRYTLCIVGVVMWLLPAAAQNAVVQSAWNATWEGSANGTQLVMETRNENERLTATITDPTGYTYLVDAMLYGSEAQGVFSDPQTGAQLNCVLRLSSGQLTLAVLSPNPSQGQQPVLELIFYPPGNAPVQEATTSNAVSLDPALVGTWMRTESSTDPNASFSFVVQWTLIMNADGTFSQFSKSAGGILGTTGAGDGQLVAQGKWKAEQKVLWIDTGTGFQPYSRFLVDAQNMMFVFGDDSRQLWSRSY